MELLFSFVCFIYLFGVFSFGKEKDNCMMQLKDFNYLSEMSLINMQAAKTSYFLKTNKVWSSEVNLSGILPD